jgi:hypothetical protein
MTKKITKILLLCIISVATFATLYHVAPVKAAAQIIIIHHRGFFSPFPVGSYGVFSVVGEVKNVGDTPANKVNITITYYKPGTPPLFLGTEVTSTYIDCVLPGTTAPFRAAYSGSNVSPDIIYTVSGPTWNNFPQGKPFWLQILNSTFYEKDTPLTTYTTGTVKNIDTTPTANATNTRLTVIYHNKTDGSIFWASSTPLTASTLASGEKVSFRLSSYPATIPQEKCNVTIVAESAEYLSQPFVNPIRDTIMPQIKDVVWLPNSPTSSEIVGINVTITKPDYASKIDKYKVKLHFRALGGTLRTKNMTQYEDLYRSTIDMFSPGQVVEFYINATDDAGNTRISTLYHYTVQGQPSSGVPVEYLLVALIAIILIVVVYKYRKRLF